MIKKRSAFEKRCPSADKSVFVQTSTSIQTVFLIKNGIKSEKYDSKGVQHFFILDKKIN